MPKSPSRSRRSSRRGSLVEREQPPPRPSPPSQGGPANPNAYPPRVSQIAAGYAAGADATHLASPAPMLSPESPQGFGADTDAGSTPGSVQERLDWLRRLEAQLGMEGVVIPQESDRPLSSGGRGGAPADETRRPGSGTGLAAGAHDRLARLQKLDAGAEEKEQLDGLLESYLKANA